MVSQRWMNRSSSAVVRSCIRDDASGRFHTAVDLVNRFEAEARAGREGRVADQLAQLGLLCSTNAPTCGSFSPPVLPLRAHLDHRHQQPDLCRMALSARRRQMRGRDGEVSLA